MKAYTVRIGDLGDQAPLFPEYRDAAAHLVEIVGVGILEGGMTSGKPSVSVVLEDADGHRVMTELSAAAWLTIGGAIKGAMARWGQPWDGA